jgi:hypothetical protein
MRNAEPRTPLEQRKTFMSSSAVRAGRGVRRDPDTGPWPAWSAASSFT